jgi:hypothetical protein
LKGNGDYELSDVPGLMQRWRASGGNNPLPLLRARVALVNACEDLMGTAAKESRGLTADERDSFDGQTAQIREINADLAKHKAARIAEHGADMIHVPY